MVKMSEDPFDRIQKCDRQTDGRTNRQTVLA